MNIAFSSISTISTGLPSSCSISCLAIWASIADAVHAFCTILIVGLSPVSSGADVSPADVSPAEVSSVFLSSSPHAAANNEPTSNKLMAIIELLRLTMSP